MVQSGKYNGWTNWETWNVALWIGNDEGLYRLSVDCGNYEAFTSTLAAEGVTQTPDGASYTDSALNVDELDDMITEAL